ncbi:acyl carrier protein [Streptomyces sp. NPDC001812]|uniref:acyl carrier protein n=1 Tax=Streptomyces TaxID=1883 RepID=UPI0036467E0E
MLKYDTVSTQDGFFAAGGDSLHAVALVNRINKEFGTRLPLQVLFETPKLQDLATRVDDGAPLRSFRLVSPHPGGYGDPVFVWPGLGGSLMNLRLLVRDARLRRHGNRVGDLPGRGVGGFSRLLCSDCRTVGNAEITRN